MVDPMLPDLYRLVGSSRTGLVVVSRIAKSAASQDFVEVIAQRCLLVGAVFSLV
jgi:hypothetical protein